MNTYLGAPLGTQGYYVYHKVEQQSLEIKHLSSIAKTHPHAAYAAFIYRLSHKWSYIARTIPNIGDCLQPLEDAIRHLLFHL